MALELDQLDLQPRQLLFVELALDRLVIGVAARLEGAVLDPLRQHPIFEGKAAERGLEGRGVFLGRDHPGDREAGLGFLLVGVLVRLALLLLPVLAFAHATPVTESRRESVLGEIRGCPYILGRAARSLAD